MGTYEQAIKILRDYVNSVHDNNKRAATRALNLKDSSILGAWLSGKKSPYLDKIGPALDIIGARFLPPAEEMMEYAIISKYAAKAGAGPSWETSEETEGLYAFRKDWLSQNGIHADKAFLLDVVGDSMEPTLREGDTLLVDANDKEMLDGRIYVVTLLDELLVKRVSKTLSSIELQSDNKMRGVIHVKQEDMNKLLIHGRVRWVGKEL